MIKDIENKTAEEQKECEAESGEWLWTFIVMMIIFGNRGISENTKINELEKKVARLEGQMTMLGGIFYE